MKNEITIAYTPDSDDAFYYYALQNNIVKLNGVKFNFVVDHIINLNHLAKAQQYDVTAISSVAYPQLDNNFRILSVGTSVGRGYGPVLVSKNFRTLKELADKRIAVGGIPTTGGFLAQSVLPNAQFSEHQFDLIADAIVDGQFDAGVMIHEELLYFPQKGLRQITDLGKEWCDKNQLPLPVGLNIINRHLDSSLKQDIADCICESLSYALTHREEAMAWASDFGRGKAGKCSDLFVSMFANEDSIHMPADVREGLKLIMQEVTDSCDETSFPKLDILDSSPQISNGALAELNKITTAA